MFTSPLFSCLQPNPAAQPPGKVGDTKTWRGYSKLRARTTLESYRRPMPRSKGPP